MIDSSWVDRGIFRVKGKLPSLSPTPLPKKNPKQGKYLNVHLIAGEPYYRSREQMGTNKSTLDLFFKAM